MSNQAERLEEQGKNMFFSWLDEKLYASRMPQILHSCRKATLTILHKEGFFTPVMVFCEMGFLSTRDLKRWQTGSIRVLRPRILLTRNMIFRCIAVMNEIGAQNGLRKVYMPFFDPSFPKNAPRRPILPFTANGDQEMERALSTTYIPKERL